MIAVLMLLTACQHSRHIKEGDEHLQQGRHSAALESYRNAQAHRPDSQKIADRIALAEERLVEETLVQVRGRLEAESYLQAIEIAARGWEQFPEERAIRKLVGEVFDRITDKAEADLERDYFSSALLLYEALETNFFDYGESLRPRIL
ncbi:MAG: hypothetical protein ACNA8W_11110, partial [Bradymonadaceae bacterium]